MLPLMAADALPIISSGVFELAIAQRGEINETQPLRHVAGLKSVKCDSLKSR